MSRSRQDTATRMTASFRVSFAHINQRLRELETVGSLLDLGEHYRMQRSKRRSIEILKVSQIEDDGVRAVMARVRGVNDIYNVRIRFTSVAGHSWFHCTCPDTTQRGHSVGPCKHTLALAQHRWDTLVPELEDVWLHMDSLLSSPGDSFDGPPQGQLPLLSAAPLTAPRPPVEHGLHVVELTLMPYKDAQRAQADLPVDGRLLAIEVVGGAKAKVADLQVNEGQNLLCQNSNGTPLDASEFPTMIPGGTHWGGLRRYPHVRKGEQVRLRCWGVNSVQVILGPIHTNETSR